MSQETFRSIVRVVQPALEKRDTQFWCALPIKKRVVIALWRLPTGNSFRTVVKTFAVVNQGLFKLLESFVMKCCI